MAHGIERTDEVFVLTLDDDQNRFNPSSIAVVHAAIDKVDAAISAGEHVALVTTGSGKFFSNGIDLDWMLGQQDAEVRSFIAEMLGLWGRVMALPVPTVAAVNGHAFAGGAMFTQAHDHVLMRADRGYWCVNEVLLKLPLAPGMQAILEHRLPAQTFRKAILTAHRFDGPSALQAGIVDEVHDAEHLLPRALELAASLAPTADPILGRLKEDLYADVLAALREGRVPAL
ncbi:MAG: enoyl-CoA hydratase-related protein [Ilumatobacter sp.]